MSRIYVASSWRNKYQPDVVRFLREAGHEVYDFKNPAPPGNNGFGWSSIDPAWLGWSPASFRAALNHPVARAGFGLDLGGMQWATEFCLVLPCGRSAHLEAGWATGKGKRTSIYIPEPVEPELMYLLAGAPAALCTSPAEVLHFHGPQHSPLCVASACTFHCPVRRARLAQEQPKTGQAALPGVDDVKANSPEDVGYPRRRK